MIFDTRWPLVLLALLCIPAHAAPLRVLCIGDSITQGGRAGVPDYTYRLPLQRSLVSMGIHADFIGTQHTGLDGNPWPKDFDPDHEGYYGQTTKTVVGLVQEHLPKLPPPDIVLIHLGTNDGWDVTLVPLATLIHELRTKNAHVMVLIADPGVQGIRGTVVRYSLQWLAWSLDSSTSPVKFVPRPQGWNVGDTYDGIHPNEIGQARLAARWIEALQ
jgi:acyl-CoA thioesterase I